MKYYRFIEFESGEVFFVGAIDQTTATIKAREIASDILRWNDIDAPMQLRCYGEVDEEYMESMVWEIY